MSSRPPAPERLATGPAKATLFYMIYVYSLAFKGFNSMGYATALAWILFMIIFILTLIVLRTSNLWVYYESEKGN